MLDTNVLAKLTNYIRARRTLGIRCLNVLFVLRINRHVGGTLLSISVSREHEKDTCADFIVLSFPVLFREATMVSRSNPKHFSKYY